MVMSDMDAKESSLVQSFLNIRMTKLDADMLECDNAFDMTY